MEDGTPILFPQQELIIDGKKKLRGGGPSCWPNFGAMPDPEHNHHYKDVDLPQHGLLRISKGGLWPISDANTTTMHFDFTAGKNFPWEHTAGVKATLLNGGLRLHHVLEGYRSCKCSNQKPMPTSMGFHPYFATFREGFAVIAGRKRFESVDIAEGKSFTIKRPTNGKVLLRLAHGDILLNLKGGGYSDFVVWTDMIEKYICVEPILGRPEYKLLEPGDLCVGVCEMTFTPA